MQLNINSYYSFLTRAPGILGSNFTNLKLASIMTYDLASRFLDVKSMHANIYPVLPDGVPDDPAKYTYYLFKTENNADVVFADVWIDNDSVQEKTTQTLMVEINRISNNDISRLNTVLTSMGLTFKTRIL